MKYSTFILSLVVAFAAGLPQGNYDRIIGGTNAGEEEFPFMASIQTDHRHICGGFIYNAEWVVTAASCVSGLLPSKLDVVVGTTTFLVTSPQEQKIPVLSIVLHDGFESTTKLHDIALISLSRPVVFGSAVEFLRYDEVDDSTPTVVTMGWGSTSATGVESTKLKKTVLSLTVDCSSYGSVEYHAGYMVCAGSGTSSPCQYDEGSPLVQNGLAIGIMSKNQGCTAPYTPSIYTRLSTYYSWLNKVAGQQPIQETTNLPTTTTEPIPTAPCFGCY